MKRIFTILSLFVCVIVNAQSKATSKKALKQSKQLVKAIFESKDRATLEKLFAPAMIYQTNDGKVETRVQAIDDISGNKATYVQANMTKGYGVSNTNDSTIVKYFFKGKENKTDGAISIYTVNLTMVWFKEKKDIKLFRLESLRIE